MRLNFVNINSKEIESAWVRLSSQLEYNSVFQSRAWIINWFDNFGFESGIKSEIVAVILDEEIEGILPIYIQKLGPLRILKFIGDGQNDYQSFILNSSKIELGNLYAEITKGDFSRSYDVVHLKKIPDIKNGKINLYEYTNHFLYSSHSIKKITDLHELKKNVPKKILADNERCIRNINKLGHLQFIFNCVGGEEMRP